MTTKPTLGVVIATPGRRSLVRTIYSIISQGLIEGDDVLIVGDGYHEPTAQLIASFGKPFRYVATRKTRDWGHSQANYGLLHVGGAWLVLQDDDDIFLPRAFTEMRTLISKLEKPQVLFGRVMTPYLGLLWKAPATPPFDGHCIVVPNDKKKLGYLDAAYDGDQVWIETSARSYDTISWADRIWTLTRPHWSLCITASDEFEDGHWAASVYRTEDFLPSSVVGAIYLYPGAHEDMWRGEIRLSPGCTPEEYGEMADMLSYAAQSKDVRLVIPGTVPEEYVKAALANNYEMHVDTPASRELAHDWPPHRKKPE